MDCNESKIVHTGRIFYFILLFVASESLLSQTKFSVNEHTTIDSLLFCRNFAAAKQAIDHEFMQLDTVQTEKATLKNIRNDLNKYRKLLEHLAFNDSSYDLSSQTSILKTALSMGNRFQADAAGDLGNRAYMLFQKAWDAYQITAGLDYFSLAQFYRVQFFEREEAYLAASVDSVMNTLSLKKYDIALSHIDALSSSEASNPSFFKFSNALADAKKKAIDGIEEERRKKDLYSQTDKFNKRWIFSIGVGRLSMSEITNSRWIFVDDNTSDVMDGRFSVQSIKAVPSLLWQADGSYFINSQLSFDLRGAYSAVYFTQAVVGNTKNPSVTSKKVETSASFHHYFYNIESTVRYYLSEELGFRVYLAGGAGYSHMKRVQTQNPIGTYFLDSLSMIKWSRFSSLAESEHSMYAVARFGTDYVNAASTYLVGAFIEENIYLNSVHLANAVTTTFGIKCGLVF